MTVAHIGSLNLSTIFLFSVVNHSMSKLIFLFKQVQIFSVGVIKETLSTRLNETSLLHSGFEVENYLE